MFRIKYAHRRSLVRDGRFRSLFSTVARFVRGLRTLKSFLLGKFRGPSVWTSWAASISRGARSGTPLLLRQPLQNINGELQLRIPPSNQQDAYNDVLVAVSQVIWEGTLGALSQLRKPGRL